MFSNQPNNSKDIDSNINLPPTSINSPTSATNEAANNINATPISNSLKLPSVENIPPHLINSYNNVNKSLTKTVSLPKITHQVTKKSISSQRPSSAAQATLAAQHIISTSSSCNKLLLKASSTAKSKLHNTTKNNSTRHIISGIKTLNLNSSISSTALAPKLKSNKSVKKISKPQLINTSKGSEEKTPSNKSLNSAPRSPKLSPMNTPMVINKSNQDNNNASKTNDDNNNNNASKKALSTRYVKMLSQHNSEPVNTARKRPPLRVNPPIASQPNTARSSRN